MAVDGIVGANYLITQLGTPYKKRDCINAVVTDVIRSCKGGKLFYRIGGCTALWNAYGDKVASKYRDITERLTLDEAMKNGMLIGDLPVIYNEKTGVCEHIAYYMGGVGGYECLHSSATKGELCPTYLKNGFTHVLRHRYITGRSPEEAGLHTGGENEAMNLSTLHRATVTTDGGALNLRSAPRKASGNILLEIPYHAEVDVHEELANGWSMVSYNGTVGYVFSSHLTKNSDEDAAVPDRITEDVDDYGSYTWGYFIPCESKDEANELSELFAIGYPIQQLGND